MLWQYLAGGLIVFGAGFGSGWQVRAWKAGADDADRLEQAALDAKRKYENADRAGQQYEGQRAGAQARERIVIQEVERVVQKPVYRSECLDDDGLRILAADIDQYAGPGQPAPAVPAASQARP